MHQKQRSNSNDSQQRVSAVSKAQEITQSYIVVTSGETTEQEQPNFDLSGNMSTAERLGFENTGVTGRENIAKVCA